jgi:hypothetical protein
MQFNKDESVRKDQIENAKVYGLLTEALTGNHIYKIAKGYWTMDENFRFLEGLKICGKKWDKV